MFNTFNGTHKISLTQASLEINIFDVSDIKLLIGKGEYLLIYLSYILTPQFWGA